MDTHHHKEKFRFYDAGEHEYANPYEVFFEGRLDVLMMFEKEDYKNRFPAFPDNEINKFIYLKAKQEQEIENNNLLNMKLPSSIFRIFDVDTKSEQTKALKGISLEQNEFKAFILKAYSQYGYKYSFYRSEHHHSGLDASKLPTFSFKDNRGNINTSGDTSMSKGEIKQAIEHRKMVVAKFLDNGDKWHCFFFTYKSLRGEEYSHEGGQPHLHYISNAFGLTRQEVLNEIRNEKYKLGSLPHINYYTHRNPRK